MAKGVNLGGVQVSAKTAAKLGKTATPRTSNSSELDSLASKTGGTVKGDRVEYQVKGPGYKATRYARVGDTPNMDAPEDYGGGATNPEQLDANLQKFSDEDPERADGVMDKLGYTGNPESDGMRSYEDAVKNLDSGGLGGTALDSAKQSLASKYGKAHEQMQGSGIPAPQDPGQARAMIADKVGANPDTSAVDAYFNEDPEWANISTQIQDFLNPITQKGSLMDDYKKLYKSSGLDDIDEEMIDAETVLDGTEDDIRNEIQTAGGLATESQVQAMTLSRNKGLLKRYNQLFAIKQSAENRLNTMIQLSSQDRQMAMQTATMQINTMFQYANFKQTALNAARESYKWLGAESLYASVGNDPAQLKRVESVLGIPSGGLSLAAQQAQTNRLMQERLLNAQVVKAENDAGIGAAAETTGQSAADQLTFLRNTVTNAQNLSGGAGHSWASRAFDNLFIGDSQRNRLAAQVDTLKSNLLTIATDPNIKKFFGPQMSDADVKAMLSAGTTLDVDSMNKKDLEAELGRLDTIFSRLQGADEWVRED